MRCTNEISLDRMISLQKREGRTTKAMYSFHRDNPTGIVLPEICRTEAPCPLIQLDSHAPSTDFRGTVGCHKGWGRREVLLRFRTQGQGCWMP